MQVSAISEGGVLASYHSPDAGSEKVFSSCKLAGKFRLSPIVESGNGEECDSELS